MTERNYKRIQTTSKVYTAIYTQHLRELVVFSSYSAPDGDQFGNPSRAKMLTEWGFDGSSAPLIGHRTSWDVKDDSRETETVEYWLCVQKKGSND